jgi:hypothetical protein
VLRLKGQSGNEFRFASHRAFVEQLTPGYSRNRTSPLAFPNSLQAPSGCEAKLWEACREIGEESSKIVALGAPSFQ